MSKQPIFRFFLSFYQIVIASKANLVFVKEASKSTLPCLNRLALITQSTGSGVGVHL